MTPVPDWLVILQVGVQVLGSLVAMTVPVIAVGGAVVAFLSYRQRRIADNRAEWWRRTSNAIELCATPGPKIGRRTGMQLLTEMLKDPTATRMDAQMLDRVVSTLIDEIVADDD